jgi:hypothetical protein
MRILQNGQSVLSYIKHLHKLKKSWSVVEPAEVEAYGKAYKEETNEN